MVEVHNDNERQSLLDKRKIPGEQARQSSSSFEHAQASWIRSLHMLCFCWLNPLLSLGYKRKLQETDLDDPPYTDKTSVLLDRLDPYDWSSATTWMIVINEFWIDYLYNALGFPAFLVASIAQPLVIRELCLNMMDEKNDSNTLSYVYATLMFITVVVQTFSEQQITFHSIRVGVRIRNALKIVIFKRSLSMKSTFWRQFDTGQIMNLIVNDTSTFEEISANLACACCSIVETIIVLGIISWLIHPITALFTLATLVLILLVQVYFCRKFSESNKTTNLSSVKRIQTVNEYIHGLNVVKMYNLERLMEDRINFWRENELASIRTTSHFRALNTTQYFISLLLFSFAAFGSAWLFGYRLTTLNTFPVLLYFAMLRSHLMFFLPICVEKAAEAILASNRIDSYVRRTMDHNYGSVSFSSTDDHHQQSQENRGRIVMNNASFTWNDEALCLSSLNVVIEKGTFVGVAGPVGSGKSSLLAAILGEIDLANGHLDTHNSSFAYAAQIPWIFIDTFRNNILLNRSFDEQRYRDVIHACCLDIDLLSFGASGDLTIIGEKGVNLSGGQKARIGLARALYSDADIYLLDDPLAAVDRIVAKQIYDRCLGFSGLLKEKTRILVTHQTHFLSKADQLIFLSHGRVDRDQQACVDHNVVEDDSESKKETLAIRDLLEDQVSVIDNKSIIADEESIHDGAYLFVWYRLLAAPPYGIFRLSLLTVLLLLAEAFYDSTNYCLRLWLNRSETDEQESSKFAYTYFGLIIVTVVADVIRTKYFFSVILSGSNDVHNNMLKGLLYTSMEFFESNPSGRILGRVSKDQHIVDELLPSVLLGGLIRILMMVGAIIMISLFNPFVLLTLIVVVPMVSWIMYFYQRSSRQLKQLESITRSPVDALFLSTLSGVPTIRAFRVEKSFIELISSKMDVSTSAYIAVHASVRWLEVRLTLSCSLVVLATSMHIILFRHQNTLAEIALCLMYAIQLSYTFHSGLQKFSESQVLMKSAERINDYSYLPNEEDKGGDQDLVSISSEWPRDGTIDFRNYSLRHRSHLIHAVRNINLHIKGGEKVGIIGRTGAGKSTLFRGIARLIDRTNVNGEILIDNVDISRIMLHRLRSHLSIIPQQPILFTGGLRFNIDPFNCCSDEECWKALELVHLKRFASDHPAGLLMEIAEFGSNLSVGQCQLISIARAILKKSKILLIDEATANVDQMTDDLIQKTIYEIFEDRTVLIIAHRLNTVAKCDRILVLDRGVVINDDTPAKILSS